MPDATTEELVERLTAEGLIGLAAAARQVGRFRAGRPTHPSTVGRWCMPGTRRPDGLVVRLEHIRMPGGRLASTEAAVRRFLTALQGDEPAEARPDCRSPAARRRASERAGRELEARGA